MARRRVVYTKYKQTHRDDQSERGLSVDRKRKAMPPGKRVSRGGKEYYEYRANRTDTAWDKPTGGKKRTRSKSTKAKKWGKIGAPKSAKRKAWLKKIRAKR